MKLKFYFANIVSTWLLCLAITFGLLALGFCVNSPGALSYGVSIVIGILSPLKLVEVIKEEKK